MYGKLGHKEQKCFQLHGLLLGKVSSASTFLSDYNTSHPSSDAPQWLLDSGAIHH